MRRWRRRGGLGARIDLLEQRVADVEDATDPTFVPDLLDDLVERVGELSLTVPSQEDLLDLRLHTARVATEVARVASELRAEGARLAAEHEVRLATVVGEVLDLRDALASADRDVEDGDAGGNGHAVLRRA